MRDYERYDYLYAAIKKRSSVRLKDCYGAFGWEVLSRAEDDRYDDGSERPRKNGEIRPQKNFLCRFGRLSFHYGVDCRGNMSFVVF